jgi:hypothetical protein
MAPARRFDVMQRPARLMAASRTIPGLRESSHVARAAGRAAADALHYSNSPLTARST